MLQTFSGRKASQDEEELRGFISLLNEEGVKSYGEIGSREGDTFHEILSSLANCRGVAMDLPGGLWGKVTTRSKLEAAINDLVKNSIDASCMFGDSKTAAAIRMFHGRGPYDAILIDGDHTLDGCTADWNNYRGMARIIAFHDIVGHGQIEKVHRNQVEVPVLWESIKSQGYRTVEFIAAGSSMGIGVVYTDSLPQEHHEL